MTTPGHDGDGATALCAIDADGVVRGGNASFAVLLGSPLDELIGEPLAERLDGAFDLAETAPQDVVGRRPDGERVRLRLTVAPLALADGPRQLIATITQRLTAAGSGPVGGLEGLLHGIGDQLYAFLIDDTGATTTTFAGPGGDALLGGTIPEGTDLITAWRRAAHPDDRAIFDRHLRTLRSIKHSEEAVRIVGLDGKARTISFRAWPTTAGGVVVVHGVASDVTARVSLERVMRASFGATQRGAEALDRARREAEHQARTDALTGVYNRRHLTEVMAAVLAGALHGAPGVAVLLLDIDHFKRINDTYGHAAGDAVLVAVARRIQTSVRKVDTVARFGGEEFCVLVDGVLDDDGLFEIAEGVRLRIEAQPVLVEGVDISVTTSIGGARAIEGLTHADDLVDAADRALYAAKRRGRNQTRLYSEWRFEDLIAEDPEAVRIAEALSLTASLREGVSSMHPMQVADLAMRTAEALGQPAAVVLRSRLGGWLHDVGKVAIPDRILTKAGTLTEDEWATMRSHPAIGGEIIQRVSGLKEAIRAVRHHHERWDGTGYPDGLRGDAIPIEARIVAAADAWSAMTSDRPHRAALEWSVALRELQGMSGSQLDPVVVPILVRLITEDRARLSSRILQGDDGIDRRYRSKDEAA